MYALTCYVWAKVWIDRAGTLTRTRTAANAPTRAMNAARITRRADTTRLEPPRRRGERRQVRRAEWDKGAGNRSRVENPQHGSTVSSSSASRADIAVGMRCGRPLLGRLGWAELDGDTVNDGRKRERHSAGSARRAHVGLLLVFRVVPLLLVA
jgi:hypothetical protein